MESMDQNLFYIAPGLLSAIVTIGLAAFTYFKMARSVDLRNIESTVTAQERELTLLRQRCDDLTHDMNECRADRERLHAEVRALRSENEIVKDRLLERLIDDRFTNGDRRSP